MTAPARDLALCELCEQRFPEGQLSAVEHCCAACLLDVREQNEASRRDLALRRLRADLRRIPSMDDDRIAEITGIVKEAWS